MLYDIGRAYGHKQINKELLLSLLMAGGGAGAGGLITIVGGKVIVKRASLKVIQAIVKALGGKILQSTLKSLFAKWVPLVGAAGMGIWARYTTNKLGEHAREIFSKQIVFEETVVDEIVLEAGVADASAPEVLSEAVIQPSLLAERIRLLVALTWIDRRADNREREFVTLLLEDPDLPTSARLELQASLESGKVTAIDYKVFEGRDDEKIATIMDMIALMKVDDQIHPAERLYIKKVSKEFQLDDADVDEMMATQPSSSA